MKTDYPECGCVVPRPKSKLRLVRASDTDPINPAWVFIEARRLAGVEVRNARQRAGGKPAYEDLSKATRQWFEDHKAELIEKAKASLARWV